MSNLKLGIVVVSMLVIVTTVSGETTIQAPSAQGLTALKVDTELFGLTRPGKMKRGQFVFVDRSPAAFPGPEDDVVRVLDGRGRLVFQRAPGLDIPEATRVNVKDVTMPGEDRLVVSVFIMNQADQYSTVLVEYDLGNAELIRTVRTFPFQCQSLHSDNEGVVWCAGFDSPKFHAGEHNYDCVLRFDQDGILLGTSLPRSSFPEASRPMVGKGPEKFGFLPGVGTPVLMVPGVREAVWFGSDGSIIDRVVLPPLPLPGVFKQELTFSRFAVGPEGNLFVTAWSTEDPEAVPRQFLFRLADGGEAWVVPENWPETISTSAQLIGADGANLVLFEKRDRTVVVLPFDSAVKAVD